MTTRSRFIRVTGMEEAWCWKEKAPTLHEMYEVSAMASMDFPQRRGTCQSCHSDSTLGSIRSRENQRLLAAAKRDAASVVADSKGPRDGFARLDWDEEVCECEHERQMHDLSEWGCHASTLKGRARCSCPKFKSASPKPVVEVQVPAPVSAERSMADELYRQSLG